MNYLEKSIHNFAVELKNEIRKAIENLPTCVDVDDKTEFVKKELVLKLLKEGK